MYTPPSLATLDDYVVRKLLSRSEQGPLVLYNYTETCAWSGAWDAVTLCCRGLILNRETQEVVALPFNKFFNYEEHGIQHNLPDRPPDCTTVKYDGSLGILYRLDGKLRWSTRGSFYSPQSAVAERLWAQRYVHVQVPDAYTLMVEIISPETRNIVQYTDEKLVLLGIRNRLTGEDLSYAEIVAWAQPWGLPVTESIDGSLESLVTRVVHMDASEEGFVARWGDYRIKLKSAQYLRLARLIQGITERRVAEYWYAKRWLAPAVTATPAEQRQQSGLPPELPEEFAADILKQLQDLEADYQRICTEFEADWAAVAHESDRRALVQRIQGKSPYFSQIMARFSGKSFDLREKTFALRFSGHPRPV